MSPRQRVVVAGGIGSGKSTVVEALSRVGWSVIDGDEIGHEALRDPDVITRVAARWPAAVAGGEVSRTSLAQAVFGHPRELRALEEITHPVIADRIDERLETAAEPVAVEISVLGAAKPRWGSVMIVYAPMALRRQRALERGMSGDDVDARMAAQPSDSDMLRAADVVVDNHGTVEELLERLRRFDRWARSA